MNAGASPTGQAFAIRNCDAFFMQASRVSVEETAAAGRQGEGSRRGSTAARSASIPSASSPAGRPDGGGGLSPSLRSSIRPTGRRSTGCWRCATSRPETVSMEEFCSQRRQYRPRQQRAADHRRSRPRGAATHRSEPARADRHRGVARELCRRAALPLRRGAAAAGAGGAAGASLTAHSVSAKKSRISMYDVRQSLSS